jgi:hypothetical protein
MFSHLKAEDFVNLLEDAELLAKRRNHLDACARCRATWESMRSVHSEISSLETDIPEPDWAQFRSSVRDELLSRSIQRQTAVRRWTGWSIRPTFAWALSLVMAVGITAMTVLWRIDSRLPASSTSIETAPAEAPFEVIEAGPERSLFDDVIALGEEEQEQLRQMLELEQKGPTSVQ